MKIINKIKRKTVGEKINLGKFTINLGRNHNLIPVMQDYPNYGINLVKIAKELRLKLGRNIKIVDVGANVGDTSAMLLSDYDYDITCIEGDEKFVELLKKNIGDYVKIIEAFVGEKQGVLTTGMNRANGTLGFIKGGDFVRIETLDNLIDECDLLKVDTDGFDKSHSSMQIIVTGKQIGRAHV